MIHTSKASLGFRHPGMATIIPQQQGAAQKEDEKENVSVDHIETGSNTDIEFDSTEETTTGAVTWLISAAVSLGGFLFGYDTGVISDVLVSIGADLGHHLSSNEQELITSLTSGGAFVGAITAGLSADRYGRKQAIYLGCFLFIVGAVLQSSAYSLAQMSVGRFVVGLGVGSAAMIIPLYIGELAPAKYRGRMIAFDNMSVTLGQLISYALGAAFAEVSHGWRAMVGLGVLPAIILAALLPMCPESPRQLLYHDHAEQALAILRRTYPNATESQLTDKLNLIQFSITEAREATAEKSMWWIFTQLWTVGSNRRALICACTVMAISQLGGFNTLMYYSSTLFGLVGFNKPTAVSIVVGATNFIFTLFNMIIIDRVGRRKILLWTVSGMCISLVVAAIAFHWIPISKDLVLEATSVNWAGILVLVTIIFYVAFFASGVATIGWVGTELLPLQVRALGTMINTMTCWGCNIIIASTFLSMMRSMTPSGAFGFYAGICGVGWVFILFAYPEVKGMPLESVRQVFINGFGVKYAAQLQKETKLARKIQMTVEKD
ncbi:hypothetical protein B7463_g9864, partial [Scytalidium lignicola]